MSDNPIPDDAPHHVSDAEEIANRLIEIGRVEENRRMLEERANQLFRIDPTVDTRAIYDEARSGYASRYGSSRYADATSARRKTAVRAVLSDATCAARSRVGHAASGRSQRPD